MVKLGICAGIDAFPRPPGGLDFIEAHVQVLLKPLRGEDELAGSLAAAAACPVPILAANCFLPGDLRSTGADVKAAELDAYVTTAFARARRVGIETIVFGSGGSRRVPDGFDHAEATGQLVGHLKRWGPIAAENGVTIVVEPLCTHDCNIITSVGEGAALVRRVAHPNVRLLVDTYHMAMDGDPPEAIAEAADLIAHVHVSEKEGRTPPGVHGEDLRQYFAPLRKAGYDGAYSLECNWADLSAQAEAALASLRQQILDA